VKEKRERLCDSTEDSVVAVVWSLDWPSTQNSDRNAGGLSGWCRSRSRLLTIDVPANIRS
jgi:hypothetical protein